MNWGGFPVGFRFPVKELTDEAKFRCWHEVFQAVAYADKTDMFFHEAQAFDHELNAQLYIPVIGFKDVGPARKDSKLWRQDASLLSGLCYYRPIVQENHLELIAPSSLVGTILSDGKLYKEPASCGFLPDLPPERKPAIKDSIGLFIRDISASNDLTPDFEEMRLLARKYPNYRIDSFFYGTGEKAVFASAANGGRLYSIQVNGASFIFAVLPGNVFLFDARQYEMMQDSACELNDLYTIVASWKMTFYWILSVHTAPPSALGINAETITEKTLFSRCAARFTGMDTVFLTKKETQEHIDFFASVPKTII